MKKPENRTEEEKNVSSQANIKDTPFDQKSQGHPEVGVFNCHRQTDKQTSRLYDWIGLGANSVKTATRNGLGLAMSNVSWAILYLRAIPCDRTMQTPACSSTCLRNQRAGTVRATEKTGQIHHRKYRTNTPQKIQDKYNTEKTGQIHDWSGHHWRALCQYWRKEETPCFLYLKYLFSFFYSDEQGLTRHRPMAYQILNNFFCVKIQSWDSHETVMKQSWDSLLLYSSCRPCRHVCSCLFS